MKTCAFFGFLSALAGAFLYLILFFTGFHSDPSKLAAAGWIGGLGGLMIAVTCMVLGVKARRAEVPETEDFGYGRALWAGVVIGAVASFFSAIFTYAYYTFINPGFLDLMVQDKMAKLEAGGMSSDRMDKAEATMRMFMAPIPQAFVGLFGGIIFGVIMALIVAAFLKRPTPDKVGM
jgi:hypothetical protein